MNGVKSAKRDLPEHSVYVELKVGMLVRCWDHCPDSIRPDRYVEGIIDYIDPRYGHIKVHVIKDSCFPLGTRLSITTPIETMFGEYGDRIQVLGYNNGRDMIRCFDEKLKVENVTRYQ